MELKSLKTKIGETISTIYTGIMSKHFCILDGGIIVTSDEGGLHANMLKFYDRKKFAFNFLWRAQEVLHIKRKL